MYLSMLTGEQLVNITQWLIVAYLGLNFMECASCTACGIPWSMRDTELPLPFLRIGIKLATGQHSAYESATINVSGMINESVSDSEPVGTHCTFVQSLSIVQFCDAAHDGVDGMSTFNAAELQCIALGGDGNSLACIVPLF